MANISYDFKKRLYSIFWQQGLVFVGTDPVTSYDAAIEGFYDGLNGTLIFHFSDGANVTESFKYDSANPGANTQGFGDLLMNVGGKIVQANNLKYTPDQQQAFIDLVTE